MDDLQRNIANKPHRQKLFAVYQAVACVGINSSDAAIGFTEFML